MDTQTFLRIPRPSALSCVRDEIEMEIELKIGEQRTWCGERNAFLDFCRIRGGTIWTIQVQVNSHPNIHLKILTKIGTYSETHRDFYRKKTRRTGSFPLWDVGIRNRQLRSNE